MDMEHKGTNKNPGTPVQGAGIDMAADKRSQTARPRVTLTLVNSPPREGEEAATNVGTVDLRWDDDAGRSIKRARRDSSPGTMELTTVRDATSRKKAKYREIVYKLEAESRALIKLVRDNPNTKKEIKEVARTIRSLMSQATTAEMQAMVGTGNTSDAEAGENEDLQTEITELKEKITVLEEARSTEGTIKCRWCIEAARKAEKDKAEAETITNQFGEGDDYAVFAELCKADWPEKAYQVRVVYGTANRATRDRDPFRLVDEELRPLDNQTGRQMTELKGQGLKPGSVGLRVQITETPNIDGPIIRQEKHKYYGMVGKVDTIKDAHQALTKLGSIATAKGRTRLAIELPGIDFDIARKLTEFTLANIKGDVVLLAGQNKDRPKTPDTTRKFQQRASVVVTAQGCSYADLLKKVKTQAAAELEDTSISQVRKNQTGNLEIRVRNAKEAEAVRDILVVKLKDATIQVKDKKTLFDIRDIDSVTTKEEVIGALTKVTGAKEDYEVISLRPAYEGTQIATVRVRDKWAQNLTDLGRIRIGLVRCRLRAHTEPPPCPRCWEPGHWAKDCKGPDFSKRCRRCGKEGHFAAGCTSESPACINCGQSGHRTGSRVCPKNVGDKASQQLQN